MHEKRTGSSIIQPPATLNELLEKQIRNLNNRIWTSGRGHFEIPSNHIIIYIYVKIYIYCIQVYQWPYVFIMASLNPSSVAKSYPSPVAMFRMSCPTISAICNNSVDVSMVTWKGMATNTNDPNRLLTQKHV